MEKRWTLLFWGLLGITTLARLFYGLALPLTGDEAYHWEWARHPALSYYDHPPLAGWVLWLTTSLLGDTVLAVRIVPVAAVTIALFLLHGYALALSGSARSAALAGILAMVTPLLAAGGVLLATDTTLLLAVAAGGWLFHRALAEDRPLPWVGLGICFGAAFLSKFLGLFLPFSCFLFLLLSPGGRASLRKGTPLLALAPLALAAAPVLAWNASHGWSTFVFNLSARHAAPSLGISHLADFLVGQALALSPAVFLLAFPALAPAVPRPGRPLSPREAPAFLALVPYAFFLAFSLVGKVGIHWPGQGIYFLVLAVALHLADRGRMRTYIAAASLAAFLTALIFLLPFAVDYLPRDWKYPLRPEKISVSELSLLRVDRETGPEVARAYESLSSRGPAFLFTRSYALSSLVAFYTPGRPQVTVLGEGSSHGRSHFLWFDPSRHQGENALFVSAKTFPEEEPFLLQRFERAEPVPLPTPADGSHPLTLVRCFGFKGNR